jgi:hypothetical protein
MNDRSLADMLAELDAELAARNDAWPTTREVLLHVDDRHPGAVRRLAAEQELRLMGCAVAHYPR